MTTTSKRSYPVVEEELREFLKILNTRDSFLPVKRCTDLTKGKEYLIVRLDRKNVQHGGKRATLVCQEDKNTWLLFLSPSYNEPKKYSVLEKLINKSKPYSLYICLEDIVMEKEYVIPIYNFVLVNQSTFERIVVPCNYYPNSMTVEEDGELIESGEVEK